MVAMGLRSVLWFVYTFLVSTGLLLASVNEVTASDTSEIILTGPERTVSEGYFQLEFQLAAPRDTQNVIIERSTSEAFQSIEASYPPLGSFQTITLSGFDDGTYYFRAINTDTGLVSNVVAVSVQHYPLSRALVLFGAGAIIFMLLVTFILKAHRKTQAGVKKGDL